MERIFASPEFLDPRVDRIGTCDDRYPVPVAERILPDGAVHLVFNLADRPAGERCADLPCLAMGATCEPTRLVFEGRIDQVCATLRVGAAAAVLGVPAAELTDRGVALEALWGAAAGETLERLHAAPSRAARIAIVAGALRERVRRAEPPSRTAAEAVRRIAARGGAVGVRALAGELGVGERRLQQLFRDEIGLTPKAACRLARFRALLARRRRDAAGRWAELALDAGFYDQAHLANEVRAFTGLTPGELAAWGDFGFFQDAVAAAG